MQSQKLDIKTILAEYKPSIELALAGVLIPEINPTFAKTRLLESINYSVLGGGKRLRAILALITAEAILKSEHKIDFENNPAYGLALALELVHAGSLIHDDLPCMDNDDLRRGKPTNHKAYGEAFALLAGDFLLCHPIEVLLKYTPTNFQTNISAVVLEFVQAINGMIAGQAMDIEFSELEKNTREELELMQSLKTGALLNASVVLSAKLAGANKAQIEALKIYANNLGLAFQITDDILDCTASAEELGKTAGKDEKQNKFTFVKLYGIEQARLIAQDLIKEAKAQIVPIGIYADKLLAVTDYVLSRSN